MEGDQIKAVGARIREALDEAVDPAQEIRVARQQLLDRVAARNVARARRGEGAWRRITVRMRRVLLVTGTAAFASVALAIWLGLPVTFRVGSVDAPRGRLGDRVEAGGAQAVSVWFSEGSSLVVGEGGSVRVLSAEPNGARVLVERGAVDVAIVHHRARSTRWGFEAGPFHVLVTGTKFRVAWKPEDQSFSLEMREGAVVVSSACLPAARTVRGGESVRLSCAPPALTSAAAPAAGARAPGLSPAAATEAEAAAIALLDQPRHAAPTAERASERSSTSGARATRAAGWRELIASGRYSDGLRAAERAGFAQACRTANEQELLSLADAARLFGRTSRAVEALGILRQRFPRSPGAATAAFSLGRIAFERQEAYADAARWFATYLDEMPNGALMGDATGRLMEARQRAGDRARARADAESYLGRFPGGPYASAARAILAQ